MMLIRFIFTIRSIIRWAGNLLRKVSKVPDYVVFTLEGDYPELPQVAGNPFLRWFRPPKLSLIELAEQFKTVAADPRVVGMVLHLRQLSMSFAKIDVLRGLITELRESGKRVVTWSYTYDTGMYYLATAADEIILLPTGSISPLGHYQHYIYLGDFLAQIGLNAEILQISPYKSAWDMFTRSEMPSEVRKMGTWLADAAYDEIINAVAEGRETDKETAEAWIDQTPCTDLQALNLGIIDCVLGESDLPEYLGDNGNPASLAPWEFASRRLFQRPLKVPGKYIALMSIEGMIVDGRSGGPPVEPPIPVPLVMDERAGDLSVVQTSRQILRDKRVAGAVVYINSRGGSATASESIRIALEKVAAKMPLVVVLGPVAASGGYWISTPGHTLFAQPNTLTGSIGVLAGKIVDVGLLDRIFIHQDTISRGENIRMYSAETPFTEDEKTKVWKVIQRIYDLFLDHVSESRGMSVEAVDAIAGGRVWTGRQAQKNGLVDELGGLDQAFSKIREIGGLNERVPVRLFTSGKQYLPPVQEAGASLRYAWEGIQLLNGGVLCLSPWVGP